MFLLLQRATCRKMHAAALILATLACSCAGSPAASSDRPTPSVERKLPAAPETRAATP